MENQAAYEQALVNIARTLPPERAVELLDFARFLQILQSQQEPVDWEELFSKPEAQRVMLDMAREAREEFHAGRTTDIAITDDGRLAPK